VFDIGFWELMLVGMVALLVFGPERLPRVAREAALWVRKARSMVASVKSEIDQELQLQELRDSLQDEKRKLAQQSAVYQRVLKKGLQEGTQELKQSKSLPEENLEHE
jgi:sec-independent protein translocase protein TatB